MGDDPLYSEEDCAYDSDCADGEKCCGGRCVNPLPSRPSLFSELVRETSLFGFYSIFDQWLKPASQDTTPNVAPAIFALVLDHLHGESCRVSCLHHFNCHSTSKSFLIESENSSFFHFWSVLCRKFFPAVGLCDRLHGGEWHGQERRQKAYLPFCVEVALFM